MFDSEKSLPSRRRWKESKRVTTATLGEWVTSLVFCSYEKKNYKYIFHNNRLMQTYLSKINCSCLIVTVHCNSQYVFCYISFINYFLCQRGRLLLALKMLRYGPAEKEFP